MINFSEKAETKAEKKERIKEVTNFLFGYARKHVFAIILYTIIGLSGVAVGLLGSFATKDLVDLITGHMTGEIVKTFCAVIGVQLATLAITVVSGYVSTLVSSRVEKKIKLDVYDEIMNTQWEELDAYNTGTLASRWNGDTAGISNGILTLGPNMISNLFRLVSALIIVLNNDPTFAIFALLGVPANYIIMRVNSKRVTKVSNENAEAVADVSMITTESFSNNQMVKSLGMVENFKRRLDGLQENMVGVRLKNQKVMAANTIATTLVMIILRYAAMGWGIYRVWSGDITYGSMTLFISLSSSLTSSVQGFVSLAPSVINLYNSSTRIIELMNLPKEDCSNQKEAEEFLNKYRKEGIGISLRNVSFTYKNGNEVFENIDFDARPKEIVALIGPSGEGKTTLLRLLLSLINSKTGEAYFFSNNGNDTDTENRIPINASSRVLMSYVPQGNTIFSGTIAENLRNIDENITDEEIIEALEMACAWEFIEKLPDGIDTVVKERGGGFSEGQAQRLAIARALIRKSPILLLDEATSALDMDTEKRVLDNISKGSYPRTCIVTTHRPAVMDYCDRVYTIKGKKVTEK